MGPRTGLDSCGKSCTHRDSIPGPSSPWQVATPTELPSPTFRNMTSPSSPPPPPHLSFPHSFPPPSSSTSSPPFPPPPSSSPSSSFSSPSFFLLVLLLLLLLLIFLLLPLVFLLLLLHLLHLILLLLLLLLFLFLLFLLLLLLLFLLSLLLFSFPFFSPQSTTPYIRFWLAQLLSPTYLHSVQLSSNCVALCTFYLPKRHLPMSKHVAVQIINCSDINCVFVGFNYKQFCLPHFAARSSSAVSLNSGTVRPHSTF